MKKIKKIFILGGILSCMSFATVSADTAYSAYKSVTVSPMGTSEKAHPTIQKKTKTNKAGKIVIKSIGGNYEMNARQSTSGPVVGSAFSKKVTVSTGDKRSLPSNEYQKAGYYAYCHFSNKINTFVSVQCTSKWKSN